MQALARDGPWYNPSLGGGCLLDDLPFGRVDLKPLISSHEHACIGDETLVVAKQTNLSLHRSTSSRVGASVLDAAKDLEVVAEVELDVVVELELVS